MKQKQEAAVKVVEEIAPAPGRVEAAQILYQLKSQPLTFQFAPENPNKGIQVYLAKGSDIPDVIKELGRLREITYREVGEGSGLSRDIDAYDNYYYHLIAFDKAEQRITGAYRLGRIDEIMAAKGWKGVYTSQFFMHEELVTQIKDNAIELGRTFILKEYQGKFTLPALWAGISKFVVDHPQYKYLLGAVSISNAYSEIAQFLMTDYLMKKAGSDIKISSVNPPQFENVEKKEQLSHEVDNVADLKALEVLIREELVRRNPKDAEDIAKLKLPPLIAMYRDVGAKFMAANSDQSFGSLDMLIVTDLSKMPAAVISKKGMGDEGAASFLRYHGVQP
jgi:putative hemolysin